jgi:hypothetical protein
VAESPPPGDPSADEVSPLLYQSNSGPTASEVSAMKPSSDMAAAAITFPMVVTLLLFSWT